MELARRAGVSRQWLIELERGKQTAEVSLVLRTLAAAGLQIDVRDPRHSPYSIAFSAASEAARQVMEHHRQPGAPRRKLVTRPPRLIAIPEGEEDHDLPQSALPTPNPKQKPRRKP